ncbi:MAG: CAP domain-containing protein [candidate division Zixibacteria bacterium]|nr:CAP domain-containing protein [candidate division Zixibacteria bacterium]
MKRVNNNIQFVFGVGFIFCLFFLLPNTVTASEVSVKNIFENINVERQKENIPSLVINETLMHIAEIRVNDMINNDYFSHQDPNGLMPWDIAIQENYNYQIIGENLALDWIQTESAINAWMESDTHKENILNTKFNETGIAIISNNSHTIIVQIFGLRHLSPATILPAVRANNQDIELNTDVSDNLVKNEQTVLTIIPKNDDSENKQVLGTTYTPYHNQEQKTVSYNQYLLLLATLTFLSISLFLLTMKTENSKNT